MPRLIFLGTSNAIPDKEHENTHMVVVADNRVVLVDCVSNPILRLEEVGVDFNDLTDLILTHFHPDHVSGVPQLLMNMWLMGRTRPLNVYGLHYTLDRVEDLMGFYSWSEWPNFFPVIFFRLPAKELTTVLDDNEMRILASPVKHMIPNIGLRFEFKKTNKSVAYSCDTEPCDEVIRLASGVDVLIHEASGPFVGHSSPAQAGSIASDAQVGALYLIHYPTGKYAMGDLEPEAMKTFTGSVKMAADYMVIDLNRNK
ncbi:MAG: ribonuclease Z [Chloroflexota bacterium]